MIENDYHLYTTSSSINNYFNHKIQSKFLSDKKKKKQNYSKRQKKKIFFFRFVLVIFLSDKSTFSSDYIFLLCKVCNNSFD